MDFSIKTSIGIAGLLMLTCPWTRASNVVYAPAFCEPSSLVISVKNKTSEAQQIWTQVRYDHDIQEKVHEVEPHEHLKIYGSSFLNEASGFSMKSWDRNALQVSANCNNNESITLTDFTSPLISHWVPAPTKTVKVHILNLFLKENSIKIKAFNRLGRLLEERKIVIEKHYDTQKFKWTLAEDVFRIDIEGQGRLHSWILYDNLTEEKAAPAASLNPVSFTVDTAKTYFLVSTKNQNPAEAFVIALTDPKQILTARNQIQNKQLEKIIVGGIELGHGGFNRAFADRDKSPYSWSVNRIDAFADFAHIDCDGSPNLTEERLLQKLSEGGRICFWRYRIVRELTPEEVASGKITGQQKIIRD